ncbi:MAG: hypothetical protein NZ700_10750 [Gemmataceae bacterium]|nr:hypothetical protein [Gemmataceae bacterium]MDW8264215.1 hypothetical protein [Gemmataceae bacterium]
MRWFRCVFQTSLVVILAIHGSGRAAEADLYLPADAALVWNINVQQLLGSAVAKEYLLDIIKSAIQDNQQVRAVLESLGFDPLRDVTSVTIAGPNLEGKSDKGLVIVRGRFNLPKFHARAEEAAKQGTLVKVHSTPEGRIYEVTPPDEKQPIYGALLDGGVLVLSPNKSYVSEALERKAGKKAPGISQELRDLLAKADFQQTMSFVALGETLGQVPIGDPEKTKAAASRIKTLMASMHVTDQVKMELVLAAKNPADAKELSKGASTGIQQLKGFISLFAASQPDLAPLIDVANTFKVSSAGNAVTITGHVNKESIEKLGKLTGK